MQIITHLLSHSILNSDYTEEPSIKHDEDEPYLSYQVIEGEDYDRLDDEQTPSPETPKRRRKRRQRDSQDLSGTSPNKGRSLMCKICDKQFESRKRYYNHTATAHRDRFQCDQCEQQFVFKYQLKKHIEVVHMELPKAKVNRPKKFQCDVCSMQFTELRILNEHTNIHTDLRPFVCEFCSEAFHNSANLRYHRKRHLNPDGYRCPVCQESFVNQQSLRKHHLRQHLEADLGNLNQFS